MTGINAIAGASMAGVLLVTACGLGNHAAYVAMAAALIVAFNPASWGQIGWAMGNHVVRGFALAFALLAVAMGVQALQGGTALYILDFVPLVMAPFAAIGLRALGERAWLDRLFVLALAGSVVAFAVAAYGNLVLDNPRPRGLENSPIHYSIMALTIGFLAAGGFFKAPSTRTAIFLLGPVLGFAAALLTGTRAALPSLGLLLVVAGGLFVAFGRIGRRNAALTVLASLVLIGAVAGLAVVFDTGAGHAIIGLGNAFQAALGNVGADTSTAYRIEQYRAFVPAFLEAPIFGHGWRNQLEAALPHMPDFAVEGYLLENWAYIHNEAMSLTLGMGILGFFAYVTLFVTPLAGLRQIRDDIDFAPRCYGIAVVVTGLFAGGITDVLFMVETPKTFLVFIVLAFLVVGRKDLR